jgi:nucleotide-binding universal stress UspA family protein
VIHADGRESTRDEVATIIERMKAEVERHFGTVPSKVAFDVVQGAREDELLALATEHHCDVIVLGHRRKRSGQRSLAKRLAMVANCSVWLVPEGSADRLSKVLVPVDFSDHSTDALSFATIIAAEQGLERCMALHVFFDPSMVRYPEHTAEVVGEERESFDKFLDTTDLHGVGVDILLEESTRPVQAILRVAKRQDVDLIVMNTHGRSRAAAILLGSITSATMEETEIPLLAFKHFGSRMSLLQALLHPRTWQRRSPKTN